jgi:hypothetical protein
MGWQAEVKSLVIGFILGTTVLWIISLAINTKNRDIKTAAIYNAIMTLVGTVFICINWMILPKIPNITGNIFFIPTIMLFVGLVISFILLMHLYNIKFLSTAFLAIVMWVVGCGINMLTVKTSPSSISHSNTTKLNERIIERAKITLLQNLNQKKLDPPNRYFLELVSGKSFQAINVVEGAGIVTFTTENGLVMSVNSSEIKSVKKIQM